MANLKKIIIGGTSYDIVDNGGRLLIGTTAELKTNVKTDLVVAINEVFDAVGTGGTNAVVTMEKATDGLSYTLKQGGSEIGVINIPKDMVVNGGSYADGNLTLNIANGDPVVIPVADLIDLYTGSVGDEITVTVDNNNVIKADVNPGSITGEHLATNAVSESKILDKNVTKAKLEQGVQDSLALADSAYQKPSTGVALTDLASGVQTSLGKADSAYQLPTGGVPKTDLASAVQTSLGKADSAYQKPSTGIPTTDLTSATQEELARLTAVTAGYSSTNTIGEAINAVSQSATQKAGTAETNAKAYTDTEAGKLQSQITAIANGTDNNFKAVEQRFENNEARIDTAEQEVVILGTKINRVLTATKETFVYDSATETLTITSSAV